MFFSLLMIVFLPLMLGIYSIDRWTAFFRGKTMMLLGLGYLFGFGIIAQWFFLLGAWGAPINAMTINGPVIGSIFLLGLISWKRGFQFQKEIPKDISWAEWLFVVFIVVFFAVAVFNVIFRIPIVSWDGTATIAYKAKIFFYERTFRFNDQLPHASYPLQVPLLFCWAAITLGQWHEYLVKLIFPLVSFSLVCLVYGFLKEQTNRRYALFGVLLMLSANYVFLHTIATYRDLMLGAYNAAVILVGVMWLKNSHRSLLILAGCFSGMAAFTKLEGMGYALIHSIFFLSLIIMNGRRRKENSVSDFLKNTVSFLFPLIMLVASYQIFKAVYHIPLGEAGKTEIFITDFGMRIGLVFREMGKEMFATTNWAFNWYLCALSLGLFLRYRTEASGWILYALLLFMMADFGLFLFTPNYCFLGGPLSMLLPRLVLHFFPLCPVFCALVLHRFMSYSE